MSMAWIAAQIQAAGQVGDLQSTRMVAAFNPRPAGQAISGSATDAVLAVLRSHPLRWFNHAELMSLINADREQPFSRVAMDWALIRLRDWSLIDTVPDESRNPRYLRYRIKQSPPHTKQKVED